MVLTGVRKTIIAGVNPGSWIKKGFMKFKKGDRVRVKGPVYANGDRVDADADGWDCTVDAKSGISPEYWHLWFNKVLIMAHEWQIRRLVPKKRKPTPPLDHVHYKFGPITGTGTIKAVPAKSPEHKHEGFGGSYGSGFNTCPVENCSWGKEYAGLGYDRSQVERAKPAPREFWLYRVKTCPEDSVWMAMSKPLRTTALPNEEFVKVREVLPDDKREP